MLAARNADMCSRCFVTEPVVRSFIRCCDSTPRGCSNCLRFLTEYSCRRRLRGNRWRTSGSYTFLPSSTVEDQKNQPADKCDQPAGNGHKHEPTHDAE